MKSGPRKVGNPGKSNQPNNFYMLDWAELAFSRPNIGIIQGQPSGSRKAIQLAYASKRIVYTIFSLKMSASKKPDQSTMMNLARENRGIKLVGTVFAVFLMLLLAIRLAEGSIRNAGLLFLQRASQVTDLESDWGTTLTDSTMSVMAKKLLEYDTMRGEQRNTSWLALGMIQFFREGNDLALQSWENINSRRILYGIGQYHESNESWDKAIQVYQVSLDKEDDVPGLSNIFYRIGSIKWFLKSPRDPEGARKAFQRAIVVDDFTGDKSVKASAHYILGRIFMENNLFANAIQEFEVALDMNKDKYEVHTHYADALWAVGRNGEAIEALKRAIDLDPTRNRAYVRLARFYQQESQFEEAIAIYKTVLELDPDSATAIKSLERLTDGSE